MATSIIKHDPFLSPKLWSDTIKPTLTNGTHYGDGCHYIKIGCLVYVWIGVAFSSAPTNVPIFTLPEGYRPLGGATIPASGGGSYNAKAQCVIDYQGKVSVTSVDKWVNGSGFFLVSA